MATLPPPPPPGYATGCTRVLLYAKMLKETENEETRLFFKFLTLLAFRFIGGTQAPWASPGYAYDFEI